MSNLSEEEIIKNLKHYLNISEYHRKEEYSSIDNYIKGLLDLYNKERVKNIELLEKLEMKKLLFVRKDRITNGILCEYYIRKDEIEKDYISKDKIREIINNSYPDIAIEKLMNILED